MGIVINTLDAKRALLKKSLVDFVKTFWDQYETADLSWSWVIEYICECYQYSVKHFLPKYVWQDWVSDETYETIKKLSGGSCPVRDKMINGQHVHNHDFNIPPRHSKSSILNVCGPVWTILNSPITVTSVSHTAGLSGEMNMKRLKVVKSEKWKYYFGKIRDLDLEEATASSIRFRNGSRLYAVCQTSFTGHGADCIIADDLVSADNARRDKAVLRNARDFFKKTLPTRLNSKTTGVIWHIEQRVARGDISGMIMDTPGLAALYSHTEIKAIAKEDMTFVFPCSGKVKHFKAGETLWPERFGDYSNIIMEVGQSEFDTQYQQDPSASTINIIKDNYIHRISNEDLAAFKVLSEVEYASHDCPVKENEYNDLHGYCHALARGNELIIDDAWQEHLGYIKEKNFMKTLDATIPGIVQVIEDKANGGALLQDLRGELGSMVAFEPGSNSKSTRLELASVYMQSGAVRFAEGEKMDIIIELLKRFPLVDHDDVIDAISQIILYHFTIRKLGVYTNAFTYQNILDKPDDFVDNYINQTFSATLEGDIVHMVSIQNDFNKDTYTVTKEWKFNTILDFEKFFKAYPGALIIDASRNNLLYALCNSPDVFITVPADESTDNWEKSVYLIKSGFFNKKIFVYNDCKKTINDTARLRYTDASRERGTDKMVSLNEGNSGCLRVAITYWKGLNGIWY